MWCECRCTPSRVRVPGVVVCVFVCVMCVRALPASWMNEGRLRGVKNACGWGQNAVACSWLCVTLHKTKLPIYIHVCPNITFAMWANLLGGYNSTYCPWPCNAHTEQTPSVSQSQGDHTCHHSSTNNSPSQNSLSLIEQQTCLAAAIPAHSSTTATHTPISTSAFDRPHS